MNNLSKPEVLSNKWLEFIFIGCTLSLFTPIAWRPLGLNLEIQDFFIGFLVLFFFTAVLVKKYYIIKIPLLLIPVTLWTFYSLIGIPFAVSVPRLIIDFLTLLSFLLTIIVVFNIEISPQLIKKLSTLLFYFSLMGALITLIYSLITGNRFAGVHQRWFNFGSYSFALFYSFYYYLFRKKNVYLFLTIIFSVVIILGRTRSKWILIPLTLSLFFSVSKAIPIRKFVKPLLILLAFLIIIVPFLPGSSEVASRAKSILTGSQQLFSRFSQQALATEIFLDYPLGVGLGQLRFYIKSYAPKYFDMSRVATSEPEKQFSLPIHLGPHSDWVSWLAELGLVGLGGYALWWYIILKVVYTTTMIKSNKHILTRVLISTFLIYLFFWSFINGGFPAGLGYVHIFLYCALYKLNLASKRNFGSNNKKDKVK